MLNAARPETRVRIRSHPRKFTWGIVDVILGLVMLPFAIWMLVIEGLVNLTTWLFNQTSRQPRSTRHPVD